MFWSENVNKAYKFFNYIIKPKLLGRYITEKEQIQLHCGVFVNVPMTGDQWLDVTMKTVKYNGSTLNALIYPMFQTQIGFVITVPIIQGLFQSVVLLLSFISLVPIIETILKLTIVFNVTSPVGDLYNYLLTQSYITIDTFSIGYFISFCPYNPHLKH